MKVLKKMNLEIAVWSPKTCLNLCLHEGKPKRMCSDTEPSHIRGSEMIIIMSHVKIVMTAADQTWTGGTLTMPMLDTSG